MVFRLIVAAIAFSLANGATECGLRGAAPGDNMDVECERFLRRNADLTRGLVAEGNNDPSWLTFVRRVQECARICLALGEECATTEHGAYNACGPCMMKRRPYNPNPGSPCDYDPKMCCQGVNPRHFPVVRIECPCPVNP